MKAVISSWITLFSLVALLAPTRALPQATPPDAAPAISLQPTSLTVLAGATATFAVVATGSPAPTYRWFKDDRPIDGASGATFTISGVGADDVAAYHVKVANRAGSVTSADALLNVTLHAGVVTAGPSSQTVDAGGTAMFHVSAIGTGLTYKWQYHHRTLDNTTDTLTLTNVGTYQDGTYTVTVSAGGEAAAVYAATLTVHSDARLTNLSARGLVGPDDERLIVGFVLQGQGTKPVLLRAIGPTLAAQFGVSDALTMPDLTLFGVGRDGRTQDSNSGWGGDATLAQAFTAVGAFPLPPDSKDAALLEPLAAGMYTAHVTGLNGATGVALAELYDTAPDAAAPKLVNLSARAYVGNAGEALIAGFVISGTTSESVLIRGVGPSLGTLYGMRKALGASHVALYDAQGAQITADDDWDNDPDVPDACDRVGAFPLPRHSHDSSLLVTLKPGVYTVHVTGREKATGIALAEIYEVR